MLTKEQMLQKGVSEEAADEIIASYSFTEDPLLDLQKALDDPSEDLLKAESEKEDEDENEDEDDFDEKYMKKYMQRFMKKNSSYCSKMMKKLNSSNEKMEKAISDIDLDAEGAIVEMTDLSPFLENQSVFNQTMVKAIDCLSNQIDGIVKSSEKSFDLMQKAAKVQVEQAKLFSNISSTSNGRKGVLVNEDLSKAGDVLKSHGDIIYTELLKATQTGDKNAGYILSAFESSGKNANLLNESQKKYINNLINNKEVK